MKEESSVLCETSGSSALKALSLASNVSITATELTAEYARVLAERDTESGRFPLRLGVSYNTAPKLKL